MASFTQREVFSEAAVILSDGSFVRWTLPTLNTFLNAGVRAIALQKPNSVESVVNLSMQAGVQQVLSDPYFQLMRAIRNQSGQPITHVSREIMDVSVPGWADPNIYPATAIVEHVIYDAAEPLNYMVYPANTGAGIIAASAAVMPTSLPNGSNPLDVTTFSAVVPLANIYQQALVDYVLSRAFSVDQAFPGAAQRQQAHYAAFAGALGIKFKAEVYASPKTTFADPTTGGVAQ